MRKHYRRSHLLLTAAAALASAGVSTRAFAQAQDFNWTGGDAVNPTLWSTTAGNNWFNASAAQAGVVWANNPNRATPNNAFFGAGPLSIQVNDNIDAALIRFNQNGWTLDPASTGVITSGAAPTLTLQADVGESTVGVVIANGSSFGGGGGVTALNMLGPGTINLTGSNTYTGNTTLTSGDLRIASLDNIGTGSVVFNGGILGIAGTGLTTIDGRIANAGTFNGGFDIADVNNTFTFNTAIAGSGNLSKTGAGVLLVTSANTNTGATTVNGGTLRLGTGNNRLNSASALNVNQGGTLDLNGFNQASGNLNGSAGGVITNSAAGTTSTLAVTLTANATYNGSINDGAGTMALSKAGASTLTLTGSSTYTGGTNITAGTVSISSDANLGAPTSPVTIDNATLLGTTTLTLSSSRGITIGANGASLHNNAGNTFMTINGPITGSGTLTRVASTANQPNGAIVLGGSSNYTGATVINGNGLTQFDTPTTIRGGIIVSANNALGSATGSTTIGATGMLGFTGGVQYTTAEPVTLTSATQLQTGTIRAISGDNLFAGPITLSTANIIAADEGSSLTLTGGFLNPSGTINKGGAGTLIFSSAQALTGTVSVVLVGTGNSPTVGVPGGTLKLQGPATLNSAPLRVGTTGQVIFDSTGNGASATARTTGTLAVGNGGFLTINGNSANDTVDSVGALNIGSFTPGEGFVVINPGAGRISTLSTSNINRETEANNQSSGAFVNFKGPHFGQPGATADVARVTFGAFSAGLQGSVTNADPNVAVVGYLPYATITDTITGQTSWATGVGGDANGLRPLLATNPSDYNTGTAQDVFKSGNALRNTSGTTTISGGANPTVNSLSLQASNVTITGGNSLRIGSTNGRNGLLSTGTGNVISVPTLVSGGNAASNTAGALVAYVEGDLTVSSNITNNAAAPNFGIAKIGPGDLILTGNNSFTTLQSNNGNVVRIFNGAISINSSTSLGNAANQVNLLTNGRLRLLPNLGTVSVPQSLNIGYPNQAHTVDSTNTFIQVDAGSTLSTPNVLTIGNNACGFTKTGPGELKFTLRSTANSQSNLVGLSYLNEGTFTLANDAPYQRGGVFVTSPNTVINYDSSVNTTTTTSRQGFVTLNGSRLNLVGNAANDTTDSLGLASLGSGASQIAITPGAGRTSTLALTQTSIFNGLERTRGATGVFSGTNIGAAAGADVARIQINGGVTLVGGILPWALTDTTVGGVGTAFASYAGGATGSILPNITNITSSIAASATGNVVLTASDNGSGTINSLTVNGSGLSVGSGTLNVTSGGVLNRGGSNSIDAATLNFGTREGIIHANTNLTVNGTIAGSNGLTKAGPGVLELTQSSACTGATAVNGGVLKLSHAQALTAASLTISGGVIGLTNASGDFTRTLGTGAGSVSLPGTSGFAAYGGDRVVNLGGAGATVTWNSANFIPNSSALLLGASDASAMVDFRNPIQLVTGVTYGATNRTIQVENGSAAVDAKISGVISGASGLTKVGAGVLEVSANNTYSGPTTINAGTLRVTGSLAAGSVLVNSGASLTLAGTGKVNGPTTVASSGFLSGASVPATGNSLAAVTINAGGTISPGGAGIANLTTEDLTLGGTTAIDIATLASFDKLSTSSGGKTVTYGGTLSLNFTGSGYANGNTFDLFDGYASFASDFASIVGNLPGATYSFDPATGVLTLSGVVSGANDSTWLTNVDGNWSTPANWSAGVPNSAGSTARFTGNTTNLVNVNGGKMIGRLFLDGGAGTTSYSISGASISFDNTGGTGTNAAINTISGSHTISAQVVTTAASNLDVDVAGGASLTLAGGIDNTAAKAITKTGGGKITLSAATTGPGGSAVTVNGGTLVAAHSGALNNAALTVNDTATVQLAAPSGSTHSVTALTFAGSGKIDLTNNQLLYPGTNASAKADITGGKIVTTSTGGVIGYGEQGGGVVKARFTVQGDATLDGATNMLDFNALAANFNQNTGVFWQHGDFNGDGNVNGLDFNAIASHFGQSLPAPLPGQALSAVGALVPEPASIGLIALGGFGLRRRRR